ncbi:MAG: GEVED domain-containing protein [Bacteroidia bacterium]|nr:GEVED domain-containing protein [Bacteroidia bacterium]
MKSILTFIFSLLICLSIGYSQEYHPEMLHDPSYNFYDVVKAGEAYFSTHFNGKGSGYKEFRRWIDENESRYYPDGDRSNVDPFFTSHAYEKFSKNNPVQHRLFPNGWNDLGPYSANNITEGYNPGIGRVESFWVNPTNNQQIYLGSRSGGFWKTNDEGTTWQNTTDFLVASGVNTIAVSPTNPDSILINVRNGGNGTSHGIFRSTDGGNSWTLTPFNPTNLGWGGLGGFGAIYKIVYHPTIPNLIFIGTSNGIYRSADNLNNWTRLYNNGDFTDIEFHPTNPNIIYLYDDYSQSQYPNQILRSTDAGLSYTPSALISGNNGQRGHIAVSPVSPDDVYFASTSGIWKSTDLGQNFSFITNPSESCRGFAVSDLSTQNMLYGYVNLQASIDSGSNFFLSASWFVPNGVPGPAYAHADLRTAECVNGVFYVGTDGYLAKSDDNGVTWDRLNDGTGIREFYRAGLSQSNWEVQMAGSQDNGTSIRNGNGWIEWNGGDGMEAVVQPLNADWMMGSWQFGSRNVTKDGGQSRQVLGNPGSGGGNADWIAPLLLDPNNQMRIYHFSDSVYYSDNFGATWNFLYSPQLGNLQLAAIAQGNSEYMAMTRFSSLLISSDGGQNFIQKTTGLPGFSITGVTFDPKYDSTIVVTYNRYVNDNQKVFISHDLGDSWTNITANLGDMPLRSVAIDHTPERNIFVGGEIGVYTKPMNGSSWTLYNTNLPNVTVRDLDIQWGSNIIRAASWGRGLWEIHLPGRQNFPAILHTNVDVPPTLSLPESGQSQDVTSVISYGDSLSSVFVKWSVNSLDLDNTISMNLLQDSTWKTSSPIPGFGWDSELFFKVYAVGTTQDTTETYRFMYKFNKVSPCLTLTNNNGTSFISQVEFGDITNTSTSEGYTDYTEREITDVYKDQLYALRVTSASLGTDSSFGVAWIDWNGDGDFDDLEESYDLGHIVNQASSSLSNAPLFLRIPQHSVLGKIRMRIMVRRGAQPGSCDFGFVGEVEDYTLNVVAAAPCSATSSVVSINSCGPFTSPSGKVFAVSGAVVDTIQRTNGCDSILAINLSITELDTSISRVGTTLSSNETGATYQWVNCTSGFNPIPGETNASFTAIQNGDYRLIVSKGSCEDTTACLSVRNVSNLPNAESFVSIYPNPSSDGKFLLKFGEPFQTCHIKVTDVQGRLVLTERLDQKDKYLIQLKAASGIYLLEVINEKKSMVYKLYVE